MTESTALAYEGVSRNGEGLVFAETRFGAMGTSVHLIVGLVTPAAQQPRSTPDLATLMDGYIDHARARIDRIETCLSRFQTDSELCQLNRLAGFPTAVSDELFPFVAAAWRARELTEGSFDPTVGGTLKRLGYDRSFEQIGTAQPNQTTWPNPTTQSSQTAQPETRFEINTECRTVSCSVDVDLDLGGIAKGMTADLVAEDLVQIGAVGACVNLGGDVRVQGTGPRDGSWTVQLACPGAVGDHEVALRAGGVCTSAITERRWLTADGLAHHIIDPESGRPANSDLRSISVIARSAAAAEVMATAALVDGLVVGSERIGANGATGLAVNSHGEVVALPGLSGFLTDQRAPDEDA